MTSVNVTTNKNTITVQEGDATTVTVATQGPQGPQGPGGAATIDDDSLDEVKLNIHADPSGTNKFLGYTSNGMEWAVPPDTNTTYSVGDNGLTKNNFTDALKTKLDSVESNSTADMTGSEIKTAYEAESDTNAFTDAEKTKLSGIATSANNYAISSDLLDEDNMATNSATKVPSQQSVKAYVDANSGTTYTAGTGLNLSGTEFSVTSLALTTVQEAANESAQLSLTTQEGDVVVRTDENKTYVRNAGTAGTMADFTLLRTPTDAVLSVNGNTGAITAAQIASAVEAASDSNTFTDADHTKLDGIEASADVTDATNVDSAGAVMNSDLDGKGELLVGNGSGDPTALAAGTDGYVLKADSNEATGLKWSAAGSGGDVNQNAFSNFAVSGQTTVAADSTTDTVTLVGGTNVTITTNATNDEITFTSTDTTYSVQDGQLSQNNFTDADHTKLDGIETNATADQTGAEIKTAYEAESDTNAYTDAEKTKLAGIEASATADQTDAEIRAAVEAASDSNVFTDADHTKLNGIEASATADMTGAEIKTAYEAESDTNAFTDSEKTKLSGIAASANNYSISSDLLDEDNMASDSATKVPSQQSVKAYVDANGGGSDTNTTYGISCVDGDNSDEEKIRLTAGGSGSGTDDVVLEAGTGLSIARSGDKITFTNTVTDTNTQLTTEEVQDIIGAMVAGNTETNISVTYDDTNGKLDFVSTDTNTTYSVVTSSANGLAPQLPGSHGGKFLKADGTWEVPPDTNTQVNIDDTPVNGVTDEAISSNWAYDHNAATGNSAHVPAAGSSGQFLKHDGTWGTPPDTTYSVQDGQLSQNNFTDADHTKLDGIETSADVTDATNVDAAGAVMNSDLDGKGEILIGDGSGDPTALAVGTNDYVLTADSNEATGVKWAAVSGGGGSGDIEGVTAGVGLTGGGTSGTVTVNADVGIGDDKLVQMDDADAADDDYAKFTANGLEGRSAAEVKTDLSLNNVENTAVSTWAGSSNITTLGTVSTVTSTAVATAGVRKIHASTSAPGNSDGAVGDLWVKY